ncbi:MAG: GMP synthase, partial [Bacteroidota bacterium]
GEGEPIFANLPNPFYVADFRDYQVVQPNVQRMDELGAKLLLLEKFRPHVPLERAMMGIRFSAEFFGVQFHPEADPEGMLIHFSAAKRKKGIIDEHGEAKFDQMIADLNDPEKIPLTHRTILPTFLDHAIEVLHLSMVSM